MCRDCWKDSLARKGYFPCEVVSNFTTTNETRFRAASGNSDVCYRDGLVASWNPSTAALAPSSAREFVFENVPDVWELVGGLAKLGKVYTECTTPPPFLPATPTTLPPPTIQDIIGNLSNGTMNISDILPDKVTNFTNATSTAAPYIPSMAANFSAIFGANGSGWLNFSEGNGSSNWSASLSQHIEDMLDDLEEAGWNATNATKGPLLNETDDDLLDFFLNFSNFSNATHLAAALLVTHIPQLLYPYKPEEQYHSDPCWKVVGDRNETVVFEHSSEEHCERKPAENSCFNDELCHIYKDCCPKAWPQTPMPIEGCGDGWQTGMKQRFVRCTTNDTTRDSHWPCWTESTNWVRPNSHLHAAGFEKTDNPLHHVVLRNVIVDDDISYLEHSEYSGGVCDHHFCVEDLEKMYMIKKCNDEMPHHLMPVCWERYCDGDGEVYVVVRQPPYCDKACWKREILRGYPSCPENLPNWGMGGVGGVVNYTSSSYDSHDIAAMTFYNPASMRSMSLQYPPLVATKMGVCWDRDRDTGSVLFRGVGDKAKADEIAYKWQECPYLELKKVPNDESGPNDWTLPDDAVCCMGGGTGFFMFVRNLCVSVSLEVYSTDSTHSPTEDHVDSTTWIVTSVWDW